MAILGKLCCMINGSCMHCIIDFRFVPFADRKPKLVQLTKLKTSKGKVLQIIKSIAPQWKTIGDLMDFDDDGNKVDLIANEHKEDGPVACCRKVFTLWLKGTHATWRNLIDLLNDCEMGELVQEIKNALKKIPISSDSKMGELQ